MEIISINITKGGCGKTTTVQMMGEILSKYHKKRVLCIDTDPQCDLSIVSGINFMEQEHNLYTLLKGDSTLEECIVKSKYYDIIPGSLLLAYADTEFNQRGREYLLKERIKNADYDAILIDSPPALGLMNIMSLTASTKVIIPAECSYLAMVGLNKLYNTLKSVHMHSNKDLCIAGILLIKYNGRININNTVLESLEKLAIQMNTKVFDSKIRETAKIKEAQSLQSPIIDWAPYCTAASDYRKFVKEFIRNLA